MAKLNLTYPRETWRMRRAFTFRDILLIDDLIIHDSEIPSIIKKKSIDFTSRVNRFFPIETFPALLRRTLFANISSDNMEDYLCVKLSDSGISTENSVAFLKSISCPFTTSLLRKQEGKKYEKKIFKKQIFRHAIQPKDCVCIHSWQRT